MLLSQTYWKFGISSVLFKIKNEYLGNLILFLGLIWLLFHLGNLYVIPSSKKG